MASKQGHAADLLQLLSQARSQAASIKEDMRKVAAAASAAQVVRLRSGMAGRALLARTPASVLGPSVLGPHSPRHLGTDCVLGSHSPRAFLAQIGSWAHTPPGPLGTNWVLGPHTHPGPLGTNCVLSCCGTDPAVNQWPNPHFHCN
jgi:hypothetical protein